MPPPLLRRLGHNESDRDRYADTIDREVDNIAQVVRQLYETLEWGDVTRLDSSVPDVVQTALQTLAGQGNEVASRFASMPRRGASPPPKQSSASWCIHCSGTPSTLHPGRQCP
jgi:hypothetical protein